MNKASLSSPRSLGLVLCLAAVAFAPGCPDPPDCPSGSCDPEVMVFSNGTPQAPRTPPAITAPAAVDGGAAGDASAAPTGAAKAPIQQQGLELNGEWDPVRAGLELSAPQAK